MKKHTKKQFKKSWGTKELAKSRAKREASSAPTAEEILVYEDFLKQSIKDIEDPRVLVLGATPELRDLALKYGCEIHALDISSYILKAMTGIMEYRDHPKNIIKQGDWLDCDKLYPENYFDLILGDASILNLTLDNQKILLQRMKKILKPEGYLVIRHSIFSKTLQLTYDNLINIYRREKASWLKITWCYGYFEPLKSKLYDSKTKRYQAGKGIIEFYKKMQKEKRRFLPEDIKKVKNVIEHGGEVNHYIFYGQEWNKFIEPCFDLIEKNDETWTLSKLVPFYYYQVKK